MEFYLRLLLYIFFGIAPSLAWLFYYLSKDLHPEPKKIILKVFLLGAAATIPTFFVQVGLSQLLNQLKLLGLFEGHPIIGDIIKWFFVIALTEELLKYVIARIGVLKSSQVDEPLDIMLYMVVAALGFAAMENIFYLFSPIDNLSFQAIIQTTLVISFIRFIGATFLHTLCSALLGYFIVLGTLRSSRKKSFLLIYGLFLATLLHGLYDFSIITLHPPLNFLIPMGIIIALAIFVFYDFDEIKKMKSICKL